MSNRLATRYFVSALIRNANICGGTATILRRGDPTAGALIILCRERGAIASLREPILDASGVYRWQAIASGDSVDEQSVTAQIERRVRIDPDLWAVELDIPNAERFIAEFGNHS